MPENLRHSSGYKCGIAAEAMRNAWATTLERGRPQRGELNPTAFLFWGHLVILCLGKRFRLWDLEQLLLVNRETGRVLG